LDKGRDRILLNLGQVEYVDSSGIGELTWSFTAIRKNGGQMKLVNVNQKAGDLLEATHLDRVFDIHKDEGSAVRSFGATAAGRIAN